MMRPGLATACLCLALGAARAGAAEAPGPKPFSDYRQRQAEYDGPGRDAPDPAETREVLIGYFGPNTPADPESGDLWCAAQLAVDEVNRAGGCLGKPLRLVAAWSDQPWTAGAPAVTRLVYQDKVWALIGGMDGPTTHLAEQVAAKARVVVLSPAATDKTVNLANVPWIFSCAAGDHLLAPALAAGIAGRVGTKTFVLVSADDHDSRRSAAALLKCLGEHKMSPAYDFQFKQGTQDFAELAVRTVDSKAEAAVILAGAQDSARLLAAVRKQGFAGPVFGGPALGRRRFLEEAGPAAEGAIFPLLYVSGPESAGFEKAFRARFGRAPDYAAAHTYDAVRLLAAAIGKAGLNRARIEDAVRGLSPWAGVTGSVKWDPTGASSRSVRLGTVREGRIVPVDVAVP